MRVFLLSPARIDGVRGRMLVAPAREPRTGSLCARLRTRDGAPVGEVFQFMSGLYFRGKLVYSRRFARPPEGSWVGSGCLVITSNRGLVPAETRITVEHLEAFGETPIDAGERRFRAPLVRDAEALRAELGDAGEVVLLGSVANAKYTSPLLEVFGDRLLFPGTFVGRGDMSRGGLLLRAAADGVELDYVRVRGAAVHGARPAKLEPRRRS